MRGIVWGVGCMPLLCGARDNDRPKSFAGFPQAQCLYPLFVFRAQPIEPLLEDGVAGLYSFVEFHPVSEKKFEPAGRERRQQPDRQVREIPMPMWRTSRDQNIRTGRHFI